MCPGFLFRLMLCKNAHIWYNQRVPNGYWKVVHNGLLFTTTLYCSKQNKGPRFIFRSMYTPALDMKYLHTHSCIFYHCHIPGTVFYEMFILTFPHRSTWQIVTRSENFLPWRKRKFFLAKKHNMAGFHHCTKHFLRGKEKLFVF